MPRAGLFVVALGLLLCGCGRGRVEGSPPEVVDREADLAETPEVPERLLSLGPSHGCVVSSVEGRPLCWGRNLDGQLGDGTGRDRSTPVPVQEVLGARQVAAGVNQSCAVVASGQLWCWGRSGDEPIVLPPHPVADLGDVSAVAAGDGFVCALRRRGQVSCLRRGEVAPVEGLPMATMIAAGGRVACAGSSEAGLWCWRPDGVGRPSQVAGLTEVRALSVSDEVGCALAPGGRLFCWRQGESARARSVSGLSEVELVALGGTGVCVLRRSGEVSRWGRDGLDQMASGVELSPAEVVIPGLEGVSELALGGGLTCALRGGSLQCWGDSSESARVSTDLGVRPAAPSATSAMTDEVLPAGGSPSLALSRGFGCEVSPLGGLRSWGENAFGQLGDGTSLDAPAGFREVRDLSGVVEVALGARRACARTAGGAVACWGELGAFNGEPQVRSSRPIRLLGVSDAAEIVLGGGGLLCLRHRSGRVSCLVDGVPHQVERLDGVEQLVAGYGAVCARRARGDLWCWGRGVNGQLGQGVDESSEVPLRVEGIGDAIDIAFGYAHVCALRRGGRVSCWGNGEDGELGDRRRGDDLHSSVPVEVAGLDDIVDLALGLNNTCALRRSGEVLCLGGNTFGQALPGGPEHVLRPGVVPGVGPLRSITCAWHLCCGSSEGAGDVSCWGEGPRPPQGVMVSVP